MLRCWQGWFPPAPQAVRGESRSLPFSASRGRPHPVARHPGESGVLHGATSSRPPSCSFLSCSALHSTSPCSRNPTCLPPPQHKAGGSVREREGKSQPDSSFLVALLLLSSFSTELPQTREFDLCER